MSRRRRAVVDALWRMTPRSALLPPAAAAVTAWSIALHLFGSAGLRGDIPMRIAITLVATALMFVVVAVGAFVLRRVRRRGTSIAVSFATFIVSAAVRAYAIQAMLIYFQMRPADMRITIERLLGATTIMTMALMAASYVATLYMESRERHAVLSREMTRLSAALQQSDDSIRQQQAQAVEQVRDLLTAQVSGLPLDSAGDAVRSLSSLVGDVVRPMSHELARSVPTWEPPDPDEIRVTWPGVWQHVDLYGATRPVLITSILAFNAINFPAVFYDGRTVVLLILVGFPFVPLGLMAVRHWLAPVVSRMPPVRRAFGITVGLLLAAAPAAVVFDLVTPPGPWDRLYTSAVLIEMLFLGWVTALGTAAIRELDSVNGELIAVQERLRWTVARTRLLQWYQQRQLSRALHGPVQTALHAAVRRIRSAVDDGLATSEAIRTERDRLEDAVIGTLAPAEAVADVRTGLLDTAALWDGLVTLEVDIADGTVATLATDPACAVIVADIAQEAVSNAIRHGNARFVSVEVGSLATDRIELIVVNDGSALIASTTSTGTTTTGTASTGLGTQQLDECSVEWSRESTAAGSALRAVLPLEAAPRQAAREVSAADTDRRFGLRAQRSVRR